MNLVPRRGLSARSGPFPALRHRNFRLFLLGQGVSTIGTWMQTTAQAWLVLTLTNSPFLLGAISAFQWIPVTLLSVVGGVLADRLPKRSLLIATQAMLMVLALVLALLVWTHSVRYWHVAVLAVLLGLVTSLDMPTRQAFFVEMVHHDDLMNAIALNSALVNVGRVVGPAIGGLIIAAAGVSAAFFLNGLSFLAVIGALALMQMKPAEPVLPRPLVGHIKEGLGYVRRTPEILTILVLLAAISTFVLNFSNVLIPVMARAILAGDAQTFGLLMSALGAGSFLAAIILAAASRRGPETGLIYAGAVASSLTVFMLGFVRGFHQAAALSFIGGVSMVVFSASSNSFVQALVPDHLRGRVMSIYSVLFAGVAPLGALLTGGVMDLWGPRAGFLVGGSLGLLAIVTVALWSRGLPPASHVTPGL